MKDSLRALTHQLIDYAGLFPPASLSMEEAVRIYDKHHHGEHRGMLARFVLPAPRLAEFESVAGVRLDEDPEPWHLSLIGSGDPASDAERSRDFNQRHEGGARIDMMEVRVSESADLGTLRDTFEGFVTYVELPASEARTSRIEALRKAGLRAKLRTGGVTEDAFPSSEAVLAFIDGCLHRRVPFKATAGLHHPVRCRRPLTYEADAPSATMHGFVNLFLAAAFLFDGLRREAVAPLLDETDVAAFTFTDDAAEWRGEAVATETIADARRILATSFGSCSFDEPLQDLALNGWLTAATNGDR